MRLISSTIGFRVFAATVARAGRRSSAVLARLVALGQDRRAVTAVEYGVMAALIATALVLSIKPLRQGLVRDFGNIAGLMTDDPTLK